MFQRQIGKKKPRSRVVTVSGTVLRKCLVLFINEKKLSKLNIRIKLTIIPKVISGFSAIPLKILTRSSTEPDDII